VNFFVADQIMDKQYSYLTRPVVIPSLIPTE